MLSINSDLPFHYSLICILLGVIYASFLYNKTRKNALKKLILVLFISRAIFITILAYLLLNPVIKSKVSNIERPIVILAKDNSESVKEDVNKDLDFIKESLKDFEVFSYSFSDKIFNGISQKNNGLKTNYSHLFSELNNKFENRNVAAVVLASDGCYNTGLNPEFLSYNFPVYSIALGDTNSYKDIRIDNVLSNDIAFFGNTFNLEISLASIIVDSEASKLKIWNNEEKIYEEDIVFSKDINYNTFIVNLPANKIGLQTYKVQVEGLNNEKNLINNVFKFYIDIIDSRYNILILKDRISPDLAAYKSAIDKHKNYKIDVKDINDNIVIEKYQLIVSFGINDIPESIINSDMPLIIFNAAQSHYDSLKSPIKFTVKGGVEELACYKSKEFSKFLFSPDLLALIAEAPPLYSSFGEYDFSGNIEFVLNQKIGNIESNNPVIMIQELDSRKVAFILSEGWWKWKLYDYSINNNNIAFDELFSKLSQYLVLQEDKSLFRLDYENQYDENNEVVFRAELYNQSYQLVNNKDIYLKLIDKKDKEYDIQFSNENNNLVAKLGVLELGTYSFIANVKGTDLVKEGVFDIKEIQIEQLGSSANHRILSKIAKLSGGKVFSLNSTQKLIETIKDGKKNIKFIHYKEKSEGLINIYLILLFLLFLISFEWFIRKYNGLI